jgi:predicted MFS family arabinose efflux permease
MAVAPRMRDPHALLGLLTVRVLLNAPLTILPPILPSVSGALQLSSAQAAALIGVVGVARVITVASLGLYLTRIARAYPVLWADVAVSVAGTAWFGLATGYTGLLAGRLLIGVGHGMIHFATLFLILQLSPPDRLGRRANLLEAVAVGSNLLHVLLAGAIAARFGWRAALLWAVLGTLVASVVLWRLGSPSAPVGKAAVTAPVTGGGACGRPPRRPVPTGTHALVGLLTVTLAICWTGVLSTLVPLYGGERLELTAAQIGAVLAGAYLVDVCLLGPAGRPSDARSRTILVVPALGLLLLGTLLIPSSRSLGTYLTATALFSAGLVIWNVPAVLVTDLVPVESRGRVLGVLQALSDATGFVASLLIGYLLGRVGYRAASWGVASVLMLTVIVATWHAIRQGRVALGASRA